jgi:ATP-dependent DNA ligase
MERRKLLEQLFEQTASDTHRIQINPYIEADAAAVYVGRWEGDQLVYAGKAQTGFKQRMLYELRERLDPYIRKASPLSVPMKKPNGLRPAPSPAQR